MGKKQRYETDIVMGETYRDVQTGLEGVATAIYFYQYGCERVTIETYDDRRKTIAGTTFDSPRLVHVKTGKQATTTRTGGPGNGFETREDPTR